MGPVRVCAVVAPRAREARRDARWRRTRRRRGVVFDVMGDVVGEIDETRNAQAFGMVKAWVRVLSSPTTYCAMKR